MPDDFAGAQAAPVSSTNGTSQETPDQNPAARDATTPDYAKLLVWGFIAGFAEKLVPDVLDPLTVKNTAAQAKSSGPGVG